MEEYFFEIDDSSRGDDVLALVIYDIIDNRKRTKLSKHLEGYGMRVQKSAFEVRISKKKYDKLMGELPRFADAEDSIRVYRIVGKSHVTAWGNSIIDEIEDVIIL